ncbi:MAG: ribosome biogenesis GTPase YlqF [Clostridia bacterium]|nr:ribosome biogenesis GTPase YlqF [Clostridia bacterium]
MYIQWFPGHMTKALRMMEENVKLVDSVIYVLDARCISASFNPSFTKLINNKTVLYIVNKCDLVEKSDADRWAKYFRDKKYSFIMTSSLSGKDRSRIVEALKNINRDMIERYRAKGVKKSVRAMVIGVPNSGKSTLINSLCGVKRTVTGDRPGVTRGKQWVTLGSGVELLDTPGTVWPKFEVNEYAKHLAFVGSIKDDVLNIEELAGEIIEFYRENHADYFENRYNLELSESKIEDILSEIGKKRGYMLSGGVIDVERSARAVADDFRKQKLGKVMLEFPPAD